MRRLAAKAVRVFCGTGVVRITSGARSGRPRRPRVMSAIAPGKPSSRSMMAWRPPPRGPRCPATMAAARWGRRSHLSELSAPSATQPCGTGRRRPCLDRLGAGRSEVQILSPRSEKGPQVRAFLVHAGGLKRRCGSIVVPMCLAVRTGAARTRQPQCPTRRARRGGTRPDRIRQQYGCWLKPQRDGAEESQSRALSAASIRSRRASILCSCSGVAVESPPTRCCWCNRSTNELVIDAVITVMKPIPSSITSAATI